jgi:hypothetical protein
MGLFLEKILGSSSTFMIFLTFRYSRCLPDQSCFLIGRNSKISEITCLMELLHNWDVRYLDLQNICVFLFVKIPRWPPPPMIIHVLFKFSLVDSFLEKLFIHFLIGSYIKICTVVAAIMNF